MKKRVLSLLLILVMLLGLLPTAALAAPAEAMAQARYQAEADGEWLDGTLAQAMDGVYEGGTVEVLEDLLLEEPLTIQKPLRLTSADPGSPCTIFYTTEERANWLLTVRANATLENIILDGRREQGLTTHAELVGVQNGTILTMADGAILQNNDNIDTSQGAGALRVVNSQTVMDEGSAIRNCRAVAGGGAAVTGGGRLVLNGGVIENCQAFVGGGIFLPQASSGDKTGTVHVYAGAIRGNQALKELEGMSYGFSLSAGCGGAIAVNQGSVYLLGGETGGVLSENYAQTAGGGLYINNGLLQLANGVIMDNQSDGYGGGISASPDTYLVVGNGPQVTGNTGGNRDEGVFDNVYLDGVEDFNVGYDTRPMTVGATLWDKTNLGVARWLRPDADHPYRIVAVPNGSKYTITQSDLEKFHSDDPAYAILLHEGNVVLANAHVAFDAQGHGIRPDSQRVGDDYKAVEPEPLTELGYDFGGWYREAACETRWDFENDTVTETQTEPLTLYAQWAPTAYPITYELNGGENAPDNPESYTVESETVTFAAPTREGYTFLGWSPETIPQGSTGAKTVTARWELVPTPTPRPHPSTSQPRDEQTLEDTQIPLTTLTALEMDDHFAYLIGFPDGTVRPQAEITRSEVAAIFFRLMAEDFRQANWATENAFFDTDGTEWYNNALSTCVQAGLIHGCPDGGFYGQRSITRAEFAAIAERFDSEEYQGPSLFSDTAGHWAQAEIDRAAQQGWVHGYPDGTFRPDAPITRAEVAALVNRMLRRTPVADGLQEDMTRWPDAPEDAWYYMDIQEATNSHTYDRDAEAGAERWTGLTENRDWAALERIKPSL